MKRISTFIFPLVLFLLLVSPTINSQTAENNKLKSADELFGDKQYEKAIEIYNDVLKENPNNNAAWYKLGLAYHTIGKYKDAIEAYNHIAKNGNPTVLYNLACSYSRANKKDEALITLKKAIEKGFTQYNLMKTDPDLVNIRNDERFGEILGSVPSCENTPESKQFDFWVGEWNVYTTQGQKGGDSKIEKLFTGCVILENWKGINGYEGKSFNFYSLTDKKWHEYWVDQNAVATSYEGNYDSTQKAIVFYSYDHAKDANPFLVRLRFFNLDSNTVRQFSEKSTDDGKTWTTQYDLTYKRKTN